MTEHDKASKRFRDLDAQLLVAKEAFLKMPLKDLKERTMTYERFRDVRREWTKATSALYEAKAD